ncbi:MAG: HEAT repeat domain-containing protein [Iphinoe sp. HA4291-MV1]|jgi:bilin biosynthesis protein|nr:HEAT repeat domain-containing protein [Iphinoe sp. HA4291-MV1]
MDKRFSNLFGLTEEEAIALLDTPLDQLAEDDSRYVAASELVNFATERSINALIRAVQNTDPSLDNRIVRRKSVESLGKLQAKQALPIIRTCLADEDCYTVENAVWAIGEIGTQDSDILEEIAQLLEKPGQTYRVIIHTLAKLDYQPALERIRKFVDASDKPTASAAISAVCRFTGDYASIDQVVALLQHPNVYARRLSIQDLIDARYYDAIPTIAQCPVSIVFRLRGIRLLAEAGIPAGAIAFSDIQPSLEQVIFDHPKDLMLVHAYDQTPTLEFLIRELYDTDFGRCYLAVQTILEAYPENAGEALMATYAAQAHNDYGAHYHVIKLLGWLNYAPGYDLLLEALHNREPQFQKSRAAAAIALGEFGDTSAIPALKGVLETKIWDLKYAALMALDKLSDTSGREIAANDQNWLIQAKATHTATS